MEYSYDLSLPSIIKIYFKILKKSVSPNARKKIVLYNIKVTILYFIIYPLVLSMAILSYFLLGLFALITRSIYPLTESELALAMKDNLNLKDNLKDLWSRYKYVFKCKKCKERICYTLSLYEVQHFLEYNPASSAWNEKHLQDNICYTCNKKS